MTAFHRYTPLRRSFFRRQSRFHAKPVHDLATGQSFDSRSEHHRYQELQLLGRTGAITNLVLHPKVVLIPAQDKAPEIAFRPDYSYTEDGRTVYEDSKHRGRDRQGYMRLTDRERLMFKLWQHFGPGVLRITERGGKVARTVTPRQPT